MPVVELASFPGSDTFVTDRNAFKPVLEKIAKTEGQISMYHGVQHEDKRTGYLVLSWETYEHHKKLMERKDYGVLMQGLEPAVTGRINMQHIEFSGDHIAAVSAPTTEFAVATLKPGHSKDELTAQIRRLTGELDKAKVCHVPSIWGESRENSGTFIIAIGWDSVEAHLEAVKADIFQSIISEIKVLADFGYTHTNLVNLESEWRMKSAL